MKLTAVTTLVLVLCCQNSWGDVVYSTNFDSLATGPTESPANPDHDGWFARFHPGASFGEIQGNVANGGKAIRQFTDASNTNGQQSIDSRVIGPLSISGITEMVLETDFFASTNDLSARNSYNATAGISGDGGDVLSFSISSGNGAVKSDIGVSISLSQFNGTDNNFGVPLTVGQNLAWDQWHSISLAANFLTNEWKSITVNGISQSLVGVALPRSFGASGPFRPSEFDRLDLQVVNADNFGFETSDSVFFDNLSVSVTSVPEPSFGCVLALVMAASAVRQWRTKR